MAGWPRSERGEERPGSMERRRRATPGRGDPRESATESKPPLFGEARVKGWGKSPPRPRRRGRHGKPRRLQDRIGLAAPPKGGAGGLRPAGRVDRMRRAATRVPDEWPSIARKREDRTRRKGHPRLSPLRIAAGGESPPSFSNPRPFRLRPALRPGRSGNAHRNLRNIRDSHGTLNMLALAYSK